MASHIRTSPERAASRRKTSLLQKTASKSTSVAVPTCWRSSRVASRFGLVRCGWVGPIIAGMSDPAVAEDVLVFRWVPDNFRLVGGKGRGAGWANIVEVSPADSPAIRNAWRSGVPVRVSADAKVNVAGPYWATDAVVVPLGHEHVVVFGGPSVADSPDGVFVTAAARAVAETGNAT